MRQSASRRRLASAESGISESVIEWQKQHGRHALPWQGTRDPYRIWLSEIMLQQTQVAAVIPYYERFLARFPDVASLAAASANDVMSHWSGLGYYSRARNLHRCAQIVCQEHGGVFPSDPARLAELPGIGRSTAAAISAFAYGTRAAILDGNVKRVFCRLFGIAGYPGERKVETALWEKAESLLPEQGIEAYTQGLMDLGATVCTRSKPSCVRCPLTARCVAHAEGNAASLPTRKPRKAIPERHALMTVIVEGGDVLLEQRPAPGIWGGLLSLPQSELADGSLQLSGSEVSDAVAALAGPFGAIGQWQPLRGRVHGFTHFKLHMQLCLVRLSRRSQRVAEDAYRWIPMKQLDAAPLPAPVRKVLAELFSEERLAV